MSQPIRIQLSRKKGWRMPPNTVKVSRPGKWGNPFRVGGYFMVGDPNPRSVIRMSWCESYAPRPGFTLIEDNAMAVEFFKRLYAKEFYLKSAQELRGKNLACWCPLTDKDGNPVPCHADVLLELANK